MRPKTGTGDPVFSKLAYVTVEQMIEIDRSLVEDYQIDLLQMMELAGRSLARLARDRFLGGNARGQTVVVLGGTGDNAGGALAGARHLHNWGALSACSSPLRRQDWPALQVASVPFSSGSA